MQFTKQFRKLFSIAALLSVLIPSVASAAPTPDSLTITAPNGGDELRGDRNITWTSIGGTIGGDTVTLVWTTNNFGSTNLIAEHIPFEIGTAVWETASTTRVVPDGTTFKLKIVSDSNGAIFDESDAVFTVDNTKPVTSPSFVAGVLGLNSYYTTFPTVRLTCADATSGCNIITYSIDGVATTTHDTIADGAFIDVPVNLQGTHNVFFYSDDQATSSVSVRNIESLKTQEVKVDTLAPTVVLSSATPNPTNGLIAVTAEFNENVTLFDISDVTVTNASVQDFVAVDGNTYTFNVSPTPGAPVAVTIDVLATEAIDIAGNDNTASNQLAYTSDTVAPTLMIGLGDNALMIGDTSLLTFTFSEAPLNFTVADITAPNGALSGFTVTGDPLVYTALYTPTTNTEAPTNVVTVGTAWSDAAGNAPIASTDSANYAVDTLAPSVTLSSSTLSPTNGLIAVTAEFSETVTGFIAGDITVAMGAVENFVAVDGNTYTFDVNPTDGASVAVTVDVLAGKAIDSAGNDNTASNQLAYTSDTVAPTLSSVVFTDTALKVDETSLVTFTFSEAIAGFTNADITLIENGTLSTVTVTGNPLIWTATFTPTVSVDDATNIITVAGNGVTDLAGNTGGPASVDSNNYAIDTIRPTLSVTLDDSALNVGDTALVTFTFSEVPTGFDVSDVITIENGILTGFAVDGVDPKIYTATFTPTDGIQDATNVIIVDETWTDPAGNTAVGDVSSANYAIDTLRPTVSVVLADSDLKAGETSLVTFTFSEVVAGFDNADITTIENGLLSAVATSDNIVFTATFTPTADLEDATNVITVTKTGVSDLAGNAGLGSTNSLNYTIDTLRPTLMIGLGVNALKIGETSLLTFTFSEVPSNFTAADITAPSGALSGFAVDGMDPKIYTALFTPTADFEDATNVVTVGTAWEDPAGNTPALSTDSANYAVDTLAPTAAITYSDADMLVKAGDVLTITANFSEPIADAPIVRIAISGSNTLTAVEMTKDTASRYTYVHTVTTGDGVATVAMSVGTDIAGNGIVSAPTSGATFAIDSTNPEPLTTIPSNATTGFSITDGTATVTYDENIVLLDASRVLLVNDATGVSVKGTVVVSGGNGTSAILNIPYTGLAFGTKYRINVKPNALEDVAGNNVLTNLISYFTTDIDRVVPVVNSFTAGTITTTGATLSVTTDESAICRYSTTDSVFSGMTLFGTTNGTSHSTVLSGLTPSTTYDYYVRCADTTAQTNTMTTSAHVTFTTATPDTTAPVITNIQASAIGQTVATIGWNTNENATSLVEYGLTSSYGASSAVDASADNTTHSVALTGLTAGTTYHFRVTSADAIPNTNTSVDGTFTTSAPDPDTIDSPVPSITTSTAIVNSDSFTISGTAGADTPTASVRTISVYNGATLAGTAVVPVGQTDWSVLVALTQNATSTFTALSTDAAGNVSTASGAVDIGDNEIIGADLTAPDAPVLTIGVVTVDADGYVVSGTAASDGGIRSVSVLNGTTVVGTAVLPAGATDWSVTVSLNQSTTNSFTAKSSDEAGNTSVASSAVVITEATAADTTAPVVTSIQSTSITSSGATIGWTTDENATSRVEYGLTSSYGASSAVDASADNTTHSVALTGLASGTTYHFRVISIDAVGNTATSDDNTFDTTVVADTTAPAVPVLTIVTAITNADTYTVAGTVATDGETRLVSVYNGATLVGTVSVPAGQTSWALLVPLNQGTINTFAATASDTTGNTSSASVSVNITEQPPAEDTTAPADPVIATGDDSVDADTYTITGTAGADAPTDGNRIVTIYRNGTVVGTLSLATGDTAWSFSATLFQGASNAFTAYSSDESGNVSGVSNTVTIVEASAPDATAPVIGSVQTSSITSSGATIGWTTDENATSRVEYGLTSSYGALSATDETADNATHSVALTGLSSGSTYHFRVISIDSLGNIGTSTDNTLDTSVVTDTTAPDAPVFTTTSAGADANTYTLAGTAADDGGTRVVTIFRDSTVVGSVSLPTGTTAWSFISPLTQNSANSFTAKSTDVAGNSSAASTAVVITEAEGTVVLAVNGIDAVRTFGTADNNFANGWSWTFRITAPTSETTLNMKFADLVSGVNSIGASNIRFYSAQSSNASASTSAISIVSANTYSADMTLASDLDSGTAGRQIEVTVEARIPVSTPAGSYGTSYGLRTLGAL